MRRIAKLLRLPPSDRRLLMMSVFVLGAVRLGLWLLPFQTVRRLINSMTRSTNHPHQHDKIPIDAVTWAIGVASRSIPSATCLTQALAAQVLLVRHGYPAQIRIGVTKDLRGHLGAHAWVESQGRIVIGDLPNLAHYKVLSPLERDRR
jgi:hypothetical protein